MRTMSDKTINRCRKAASIAKCDFEGGYYIKGQLKTIYSRGEDKVLGVTPNGFTISDIAMYLESSFKDGEGLPQWIEDEINKEKNTCK